MNRDTDRWVSSDQARTRFRDLLDDVTQEDAHVYVLRHGKPAAVIVPVGWYEEVKATISESEGGK